MYIAMFVEIQYVHSYVCWGAVCTSLVFVGVHYAHSYVC